MVPRPLLVVLTCALAAAAACGPGLDLPTALAVTNVDTGFYDNGVKDSKNYLVPSISFVLENKTADSVSSVQVLVSFWKNGDDGEWDSKTVAGIDSHGLAAGKGTIPILVRCPIGYTLEGARADFFQHSLFQDVTVKIFGQHRGTSAKLGEFKIERRIIAHSLTTPGRP